MTEVTNFIRNQIESIRKDPQAIGSLLHPSFNVLSHFKSPGRFGPYDIIDIVDVPSLTIPRHTINNALFFSDNIAWPRFNIGMGYPVVESHELNPVFMSPKVTFIDVPIVPVAKSGMINLHANTLTITGENARQVISACIDAFHELDRVNPGGWILQSDNRNIAKQIANSATNALILSLEGVVPIIREVKDYHLFLRWLERREPERQQLLTLLNNIAIQVSKSESPETEFGRQSERIRGACQDVIKVANEDNHLFSVGPVEIGINGDFGDMFRSGMVREVGSHVGSNLIFGLELAPLVAMSSAMFTLKWGKSTKTNHPYGAPFMFVSKLQYP